MSAPEIGVSRRAPAVGEQALRSLLDAVDDHVWIATVGLDRVVYSNAAFERIYGEAVADLYRDPRCWLDRLDPRDRARLMDLAAAAEPRDHAIECTVHRRDGTARQVRVRMLRISGVAGTATVAGMTEDVTRERATEAEVERLDDELHRAYRLDALGQLAGGIAHDFNNLLSVIVNNLTLSLDEVPESSQVGADIVAAVRAAERASALTRQLLLFARRDPAQPVELDLDEHLRGLHSLLERTVGAHIEVRLQPDSGHARVMIDPSRLEQVVLNLVINARDAMPHGGLLRVSSTAVDVAAGERDDVAPGRYACLLVSDEGSGMPADVAARAFEPFFTTKPAGHGSGLGLATVHTVATDAGGTATIHSRPDSGTVVAVWLPAIAGPEPRADRRTRRPTVLLLEDDEEVRRSTARILEGRGYAVLGCANATRALELWMAHRHQIVALVTDLGMPGHAPIDAVRVMRGDVPDVPVLILSGSATDVPDLGGATALLRKPFTRDELVSALNAVRAAGTSDVTG